MNEEVVKAITRLEVQMQTVIQSIAELKTELKQPRLPVLSVTGGVVGFLAAAWTAYIQASGQA